MSIAELREPTFLILTALAGGRRHGYSIIQETRALSDDRVVLKVGTLYAALDRLEKQGLVSRAGDEAVDGRLRRYFELSESGASLLEAEADRMEHNLAAARRNLRLRPATTKVAGGLA